MCKKLYSRGYIDWVANLFHIDTYMHKPITIPVTYITVILVTIHILLILHLICYIYMSINLHKNCYNS